jgi:hypothetical protein
MKNYLLLVVVIMGFTLIGCSKVEMTGAVPPDVYLKIDNSTYNTTLGTYCWKNMCVDTVGPTEMLKGTEPIIVKPSEKISIDMDYEPKPNEVSVTQFIGEERKEVPLEGNAFTAPPQSGIYYYSYGVGWMDEKEENLSHGDAFYAFVLEVNPDSEVENNHAHIREIAWNFLTEKGWNNRAKDDWKSAKVNKIIVNENYELLDSNYKGKVAFSVSFEDQDNTLIGTPVVLVDSHTNKVIGYMLSE